MSSNQTIVTNNGGGGDNNSDTKVAVVALVVSVVALLGTLLQVGQQYLASAAGYSSCDESVIGPWHKTKQRQFRYSEMRFRVLFKSPVFFVCAADNKLGPVPGAKVYFANGTEDSIKRTLSLSVEDLKPPQPPQPTPASSQLDGTNTANGNPNLNFIDMSIKKAAIKLGDLGGVCRRQWSKSKRHVPEPPTEKRDDNAQDDSDLDAASPAPPSCGDQKGVHTVDSEMATWVRLLQEVHRMEKYSMAWEAELLGRLKGNHPEVPAFKTALAFKTHTLCVAIQSKEHSWDTMPASVNRPYATTTISHMLEMAAMLGIYWKQFDEISRNYRAEGNGYVLTGSRLADFGGIFFTFQISGKNVFAENRIIPADECKEFAFGLVPTIFRQTDDIRRLKFKVDDIHNLGTLLLGSPRQFGETLASIGCNTYSSNCLQNEGARHGHLFPLSFEVMGMVGKKLHRKGSAFRFLPNPSYSHWDKKYFNLNLLLRAYNLEINKVTDLDGSNKDGNKFGAVQAKRLVWLKEAANAVDTQMPKIIDQCKVDYELMELLDHKITVCDDFLRAKGRDRVGLVLRQHIQQVLYMVNGENPSKPGIHDTKKNKVTRYDKLMAATPADRQNLLMNIYFTDLRKVVASKAEASHADQGKAEASHTDQGKAEASHTDQGKAEASHPDQGSVPDPAAFASNDAKSWAYPDGFGVPRKPEETDFIEACELLEAEAVWCTLVFRMLCWLTLHDFNKADVQLEKHELLGSRLPVFIR